MTGRATAPPVPGVLLVPVVYSAAAAAAVAALAHTARDGLAQPEVALAHGLLIAVAEAVRAGARDTAPAGAAGALAYALLGEVGGRPAAHSAAQAVAVVLAATLIGALGRPPSLDHLARRTLTCAFAAVCVRPLHSAGMLGHGPAHVLSLLAVLALTALCDAVLAAALTTARTGGPYPAALADEVRALPGVSAAIGATGAVMALAVAVAGLWALPVLGLPLLIAQLSGHRRPAGRATRRQTVAALARCTEVAGHTPPGHARRVAALGRATGRELGLSEARLTVVEYAALTHDIGQLSLHEPLPAGATEPLPAERRRRIALLGGAVVRRTGVPAEVARVVERQADPYRRQPLAARILRTANAYEELTAAAGCGPLTALERLRLATGHEHDPRVVAALARVLVRGDLAPGPAPTSSKTCRQACVGG
ncbi:HD-GYP domain-containing protein [Streptomyces gamaensis]|uniref:HD-GYP domain-containing protein n=1 Tax=Streptomyces gamaensis TaxID=1763542 RepID=A0ABW0YTE0_9ACTN